MLIVLTRVAVVVVVVVDVGGGGVVVAIVAVNDAATLLLDLDELEKVMMVIGHYITMQLVRLLVCGQQC